MGQVNSTTTDNFNLNETVKYQDFVKNYHFVRKTKDSRYGDISLLQDKSSKELAALREIVLDNEQDFQRNIELLRVRSKISHPNIVKLLRYTTKPDDIFRAAVHKILIIVEYLENDLEKEIKQRKSKNDYYKEEQLWYLLENVLKVFSTLQKNNVVHGDIKPSSIFISKMGMYKISQPGITSTTNSTYTRPLTGTNDGKGYISPSLLTSLQKGELKAVHDVWKSDVFSLGMVLLHTATLNSCDNLYNWKNKTLNLEEFEQRLSTLKILYSDNFQKAIRLMLTLQEDQRPDFINLETMLFGAGTLGTNKSLNQPRPSLTPKAKSTKMPGPGVDSSGKNVQEKRSKIITPLKAALQENQQNVQRCVTSPVAKPMMNKETPLKPNEHTALHQGKTLAKSPSKLLFAPQTGSPNCFDKNKLRILDENMRFATEPHQNRFMSQTTPKEKAFLNNREISPKPLSTVNFTTQSEFSEPDESTQAPPVFPASLTTIKSETKTTASSLNDLQTKEVFTSPREEKQLEYKSLISSEVAQLMANFKNRKERDRSPTIANLNNSNNQDPLKQQKENVRYSEEFNSIQGPTGKMLKVMMNGGSVKYADARGPVNSSMNTSAQKEAMFQNPFNFESYAPNQQIDNVGKRDNSLTQSWQPGSPKPVQTPMTFRATGNNYFVPSGYANFTPTKPLISSPNNISAPVFQGSPINSFDPDRRTSNYQAYLAQQQSMQFERSSLTLNQNISNINVSSPEQFSNKRASLDPSYALAPRSPNQNFYTEPFDSYGLQPKSSIKYSQSPNLVQQKQFLMNPIEAEVITEKFADGSVYKGQKKNGLRHGKGTFCHSDGATYTGDWVEGVMEGQGTLYYAGGSKAYVGQWRVDKFHGKGAVYNEFPVKLMSDFDFRNFDNVGEHWVKYEGDFIHDNKQGTGTLFLTNGEKFNGQFREDMVEGIGIFYTRSGVAFKGEWWQNKLIRPLYE